MNTRPRLIRRIPFWVLIVGSLASAAGGAYLLVTKLGTMDAGLLDGTATTSDVYVGQIWGVTGAILIGAGIVGLLLALSVASLRAFAPQAPAVDEPVAAASTDDEGADATDDDSAEPTADAGESLGYDSELGYTPAETVATR
ncbi:dinucleotide-utilizing enzyme [Microbacterium invictum]|uniref:Dinucleotide-utilizing enzyme n=1 Tax=Microbacterium invictum TaxID=515415 RepID=A0AA40VM48_9MICO|nr:MULTISPECIES: dinucleotide-utilizing enzyme [Microbacterium]MBB4139309.1 hypothetical protein [Microbacterium invictum]